MDLVKELEKVLNEMIEKLYISPQYLRLISGKISEEEYLYFLTQTYHYVINTPKSLLTAAENLAGHPNPVYQMSRERFIEHAKEETGHHLWVLNDVKGLGYEPEIVTNASPCPAVNAYNAYSHFVVTSANPIALFGEAYILEGFSEKIFPITVKNLETHSQIPNIKQAMWFIVSHGEADVGHMESLRNVLGKITDENDKKAILLCAEVVAQVYANLLHYSPVMDNPELVESAN